MFLFEFCVVKVNFPEADFWLIRLGSQNKVGMPVKKFYKEHIGIKVTRIDILIPEYLFYVFLDLFNRKYFKNFCAQGTLNLVYIKVSQVERLKFETS
ncbi:hypothetical protein [Silvanigrella aquatica]|uniref:Uncharacterized protein n=1 Tax=Silvanigrella aquatica TaxID=1915309 RepID=A0A1L4D4W1_9BACT|nr:hypothetical protein [Silvanigrella aquatica]APJ05243.1 hypothetical protein AXG55_14570 [Silvanigrella aquatica]